MSASGAESESNIRRVRPVRVLVAADDPRFLAVATILLSRAGFDVFSTARLDDVVTIVERDRPNAVVLDATNAVTAAARCAAAVERLRFPVHVLVVSDDPAARAPFARFEKWDSFSEIVAEIERVSGGGGAANDRSAER